MGGVQASGRATCCGVLAVVALCLFFAQLVVALVALVDP